MLFIRIKTIKSSRIVAIILSLVMCQTIHAQVLPGDADNNGKVENIDFLYIGYGYGETGPSRISISSSPQEQVIPFFWDAIFPTGLNLAFADANGDGIVNYFDFLSTFQNYGFAQGNYTAPIYYQSPTGTPLFIAREDIPNKVTEGTEFDLPISLGAENGLTQSFSGIAFTIEYNPDFIKNFTLDFSGTWLGDNLELFQMVKKQYNGKIEIALSRLGDTPAYGNGNIGRASFIIEEDLVGWLASPQDSIETTIRISKIVYKSAQFETQPTTTQDVNIMLYHPDALLAKENPKLPKSVINIFPNPAKDEIHISSAQTIKCVIIYDLRGIIVHQATYNQKEIHLNKLQSFNTGLYMLQVQTSKGPITKKLFIQK